MTDIDFDVIEEELGIVVPNIYRMFVEAVNLKGYNLEKFGIYHDTEAILRGNYLLRDSLSESDPKWKNEYFDFGVGDGCGNYFFLVTSDEESDEIKLWAHDPCGIEKIGSGTSFFMSLISELEAGFNGPDQYRFQGNLA